MYLFLLLGIQWSMNYTCATYILWVHQFLYSISWYQFVWSTTDLILQMIMKPFSVPTPPRTTIVFPPSWWNKCKLFIEKLYDLFFHAYCSELYRKFLHTLKPTLKCIYMKTGMCYKIRICPPILTLIKVKYGLCDTILYFNLRWEHARVSPQSVAWNLRDDD